MTPTFIILAIVALTLLWLANGVRRIGAVSQGREIGSRPNTALLMIDLQTVFWNDGPYDADAKKAVEAAILGEVAAAREKGYPVIAVRQEWSLPATRVIARLLMRGQAIAGTKGTEIAAPFADAADKTLVKRVQDAFETGELDRLLARLEVGTLRIVGLDFNYCVAKTALAARRRGYDVEIVTEGTLAAATTAAMEATLDRCGVRRI